MKNVLLILFLLLSFCVSAQDVSVKKIGRYSWEEAVMLQPCDFKGADEKDAGGNVLPPVISLPGQGFRLLKVIDGGFAIIQILDYTQQAASAKDGKMYMPTINFFKYNFSGDSAAYSILKSEEANSRNYGNKQRYFKVGTSLIEDYAVKDSKIGGSLAAGVINFPFKYRPQKGNGDFSGAFNFGAGLGYKFPHKSWRQFTYSVLSGYSISNVVLDSSNANKNQGKLASSNNFTAFSFSLGVLAEYQRVQAGIFIGWDRIGKLNQREFEWQYQGKMWISVGFGFAIFSGQKEKREKDATETVQQ